MKYPTVGRPGVNYYALLGVTSTATQDEITKSFRKKILTVHLDKMGPEDDTELCYLTIEAHRILSDKGMRAKYDVERSSSKDYKGDKEVFIPAGYICYDVGHQQMSRQILDSISNWTSEYDKCAKELSDNYFHCFSQLMTQVMCDNGGDFDLGKELDVHNLPEQLPLQHYYCGICDKNYITETHHWDVVVNPYRAMFYSDQQGIGALNGYFQGLIGPKLYNWEPRYLPSRILGIWSSPDWSMLTVLHHEASGILKECDYPPPSSSSPANDISSTLSKLESYSIENKGESFRTSHTAFIRRSLIQNLVWVLENRDHTERMISRMSELICQDDLQEILCLAMAMRNVLSFQHSEWEQLIQEALKEEQFELSMLWTMLAIECGDKSKGEWFQLGMTIRLSDPVLAHFCFLLSGSDSPQAWEELANIFTQNGAHFAAAEYHLNKGNLFQLLHKSKALKGLDAEGAGIYSGIYHATRVKGLLQVLLKRSRLPCSERNDVHNEELEELIEIVQDLASTSNPLEGFRIIVTTWPDVFEEAPGYWIHRATIQFLRKGRLNLKSAKLILAAAHFLPVEERLEEISSMVKDASLLTRELLERALETNDFELLTDVLLHLNKRTLPTAAQYLEEIKPPPEVNIDEEKSLEDEEDKQVPPQEPLQTNTAPGYKSAMLLLLSGTIYKVREVWLDAMKDYQNALLSAPECIHRVLPCVSKLVQDIQFHEAVVTQVQTEIQDLQRSLVNKEYPDIDKYNSDKRRSLILTDCSPKMDYGYKDSVNKIQTDPDKIPGPSPEDEPMDAPPPPPANTPMVTLDKNSEAIQSGQSDGQMDQLSAALAYVDLLKALPLQMHPGPIVMAASHFLHAMDDSSTEIGKLYAYRNAIMLMAENLLRVDRKLQATIHHGLTHKHMLSILLSAHEKLSKALAAKKIEDDSNDEQHLAPSEDELTGGDKDKKKKDLIRKSEAKLISKFLKNVVNFPKVEPLASMPTLNCNDLVYVETLGNSFLSQFCADKVRQKHQSPMIPKHLHAYTHFVEVWKGRSTLSDFPQARVKAMEELLAQRGWTLGDVERKMMWPFLTLKDGFSPSLQCLLRLRDPMRSYRSIDGFHIDYVKGQVSLILSRDTLNPIDTLFDIHDIRDVVSLSKTGIMEKICFSLESPDVALSSHPFKEGRIYVGQGNKGGYQSKEAQQRIWSQIPESVQASLSRVSLLLCYLASGLELSSETPFWMRRTDEGLLTRLDEHLQYFARPISWRKQERKGNLEEKKSFFEVETVTKFWLNMVEIFEEIEEEDGSDEGSILPQGYLTYRVGNMRTEVRPNTLVMTLDPRGNLKKLSPEAEFARDLTRNFPELARAFPELARLEELVKISVVCSKLRQVLKENRALLQEFSLSCDNSEGNKGFKGVSKVCGIIEEFLTVEKVGNGEESCCNWFPALFCHNADADVFDVSAGVELDPVVTYGPVAPPVRPISLPLGKVVNIEEENMGLGKLSEEEEAPVKQTVIQNESREEEVESPENILQDEDEVESEEESEEEDQSEDEDSPPEVTDHDNDSISVKIVKIPDKRVRSLMSNSSEEIDNEEDSDEEESESGSEAHSEQNEDTDYNVSEVELDEDALEVGEEEKVIKKELPQENVEDESEPEVSEDESPLPEVEEAVTIVIRRRSVLIEEIENDKEGESEKEEDDEYEEVEEESEVESDPEEISEVEEPSNDDILNEDEHSEADEVDDGEEYEDASCEEIDKADQSNLSDEVEQDDSDEVKNSPVKCSDEEDEGPPITNGHTPQTNGTTHNNTSSQEIDEKSCVKLRERSSSLTKRTFLSRRGKIMIDGSIIKGNKDEQNEKCSDESDKEELILSK